jgi:hypothetical protein
MALIEGVALTLLFVGFAPMDVVPKNRGSKRVTVFEVSPEF